MRRFGKARWLSRLRLSFVAVGLVALVVGPLIAPLVADAQGPKAIPRIGMLGNTSESAEAIRQALRELGYVEGQTIMIEERWAAGQLDRLPALAAELVRLPVDVLVTVTHRVALVAKATTTTVPIVFARVNDPVGVGLVASLARPGGNVTGVSLQGLELIGKRLQLLKEVVPRLTRVGYLRNPTEPYSPAYWREVQAAAQKLGVTQVLSLEVRGADEFEAAFAELTHARPNALLVEPNSLTLTYRQRIADVALAQRLPAMYAERRFMDANGLMSYGPSLPDHFRRVAAHVDKILKGAKPADLPVEQPMRFELVINLKTAKALGLTIPPSVLIRADRVIE